MIDIEPSSKLSPVPLWEKLLSSILRRVPGMESASISTRVRSAIHGSSWTLIGYGAGQILRLTTQLVLAHILLGPAAFGLVALVNVFLSGLEMLSDLGIGMDVIQHPRGDDPGFINTAFVIQVVRGAILFSIAAALAYPFALFYHQPAARMLIIVAAISTLVRGFSSGSIWTMTRHLEFKKLSLLNIFSEVVGLAVSLLWVYISPSVWALVVGRVAAPVAYTIASHFVDKRRMLFQWDPTAARDVLAFGTGIFLSTATYFLSGESERLIVGKFTTIAELGCFSLALSLASAPAQALMQVAGQVFFPMIANSIREDRVTSARHYKKARTIFAVISIVLGVFFVMCGPRLVALLLPAKFAMTGWMLQLLGVRSAQQIFSAPTTNMIFAHGNSRYAAVSNVVRFICMTTGLWLAFTRFGIHAAIAVLVIASFAGYVVLIPAVARFQPKALWFELGSSATFAGALGIAAVVPSVWSILR
jgi:O-antigen/teichoic acid export membrane protein